MDNGVHEPMAEVDITNFDNTINIHTFGMLLCCRAQAAAMRKQPAKLFTSRNGTRSIINVRLGKVLRRTPGKRPLHDLETRMHGADKDDGPRPFPRGDTG
ncbi:hypothetical protein BJX68DRAFT_269798 [Aspergillus pseudodeflectus]|uniref:Uncharacterized protein n=1 Tax=Aspergillus pseudodeflectus TaxID=176178 RepID=A0ABR4JWR9_9EURO